MSTTTRSKPTAELSRLNALQARLGDCLLRDAREFERRLAGLKRRAREGKPVDRGLAEIERRLTASQAALTHRQALPVRLEYPPELPVAERREEILAALRDHQVVVVAGETGSGKTTQLPKLCLELGLGRRGLIGHTQPRRLAARSVATRLAEELAVPVGEQVGYQVRFTDHTGDRTLVKLMTDGILLAETQHDPDLSRYEAIIIDEAHERSLNIDFLLGYLKRLIVRRPDLKIIITSATIDVDRFSNHFASPPGKPAPVVQVSGRTYPVDVHYRPLLREEADEEDRTLQEGILHAVEEIETIEREKRWFHGPRDVLIFLPGEREIRETADTLRRADLKQTEILPLYARLSSAEQNRVFQAHSGRRIVLSTNVAETSLTVPGIRYVIDPGLVRISRYSYRAKVQRLPIEPVSQASADQRKGRCGRVAEGVCIRLYSEEDYLSRPEYTEPEIQRTNLASVILSMLSLKLGDIEDFPFVDAPDSRFIKDGFRLLFELGAVDERQSLTATGRRLARLPIDPRLARMVLAGATSGCLREVLIVVSALAVQDPRERPAEKRQAADQAHKRWDDPDSDFVAWLNLWLGFEAAREELSGNQLRRWCREHYLNYLRLREWHDTFRQLKQLLRDMDITVPAAAPLSDKGSDEDPEVDNEQRVRQRRESRVKLHQALLTGLLSNIGQLLENREYLGARNRKFMIHPGSGLAKKSPKWVMAGELVETSRLFARQAARIEPQWIEPLAEHLVKRTYSEPHWEMNRAQVVAFEQVTLFGLPIVARRKVHYGPIAPREAREIFIRRALVEGEYRTNAAFFTHNRDMIEQIEDLEDRARKRDILVDEETLFDFYDQRLPDDIINGKGFERWRKQAEAESPDILKFDREALMAREAEDVTAVQYPDELVLNGVRYPLSYHFQPGASDDGVTLTVPAAMLSQLPVARLEWLVPGLLREKCIALLKSLPKSVRRQVVPIPDWVDAALERLVPDDVPLTAALGEFLRVKTGMRLHPDDWRPEQLEPHLVMNVRVVDHDGQVLGEGRDPIELERRFAQAASAGARALSKEIVAEDHLDGLPEAGLPESRVTTQAGIRVEAYPALVETKGGLAVELFEHPDKAHEAHRHGIKHLAMQRLPDQVRLLQRLPGLERCALLFAKVGSKRQLVDDVVEAVFLQVIATEPLPRTPHALAERLDEHRADLVPHGESLVATLESALKGHLEVTKALKGNLSFALALVYSDLKAQMERLVHPGFVAKAGGWLEHYPRYMEAAMIRLEKAPRERMRDQMLMQEVHEFETRLAGRREMSRRAGMEDPRLVEFGWWIEELRVSLFAQQLGTLMPVSGKRLEKRWAEITGQG
ncbi:RNA helicase [Litchfieldella anticariensis FP35 = DSM 16096]|uniref:RNA helicase n=1 Tax=Litchfieldella anticariensis (strain DSM 16096 / CECT 5854 / CIP 108499 / LMG 22089 / FP35) TaxID=1121939 RepID=S2KYL3_LITA3|nr:ATP-dependent RNA helicase HrpA [Halomonas anticariensis]EPC00474.1 RNA helicase [Halomonas anticariensis FP35 = DSM 16096]